MDVDGRGGKVGGAIDVRSWLNSYDAWESCRSNEANDG